MIQKCVLILSLFLATPGLSDDPEQPKHLLGFVETEMLVGMQAVDGTAQLVLHIYSEEEYQLAREIVKLPRSQRGLRASALAEKHPSVKARLQRYIETLPAVDGRENLISSIVVSPLPRFSFGRVAAVGDDYVLVELEGDANRRRAIPSGSIGRLELNAEAVGFMRL